jgi:hypothetical protein
VVFFSVVITGSDNSIPVTAVENHRTVRVCKVLDCSSASFLVLIRSW